MASTQVRLGQQALAVLDVALRVPCIFIIDAIFNSYYDPGSGWAGTAGKIFIRVIGKRTASSIVRDTGLSTALNKVTVSQLAACACHLSIAVSSQVVLHPDHADLRAALTLSKIATLTQHLTLG